MKISQGGMAANISLAYSLLGNGLILAGSLSQNAVDLRKTLVILIRQLAFLDLMATATLIINGIGSIIDLGDSQCDLIFFTYYAYHLTSCCLMAVLGTVAFLEVKFGDESHSELLLRRRENWTYRISLAVWIISFGVTSALFIKEKGNLTEFHSDHCEIDDEPDSGVGYLITMMISYIWAFLSLPLLVAPWIGVQVEAEKQREIKTSALLLVFHFLFLNPVITTKFPSGPSSQFLVLVPQHFLVSYKFFVFFLIVPSYRRYSKDMWTKFVSHCWENWIKITDGAIRAVDREILVRSRDVRELEIADVEGTRRELENDEAGASRVEQVRASRVEEGRIHKVKEERVRKAEKGRFDSVKGRRVGRVEDVIVAEKDLQESQENDSSSEKSESSSVWVALVNIMTPMGSMGTYKIYGN